ncbi:MAG: hypothetical protein JSR46_09340, partial [Verrucomicrobia bacterium]|nr:hypothetical protein [Verrucomicrobiota bacterium]
MEQLYAEKKPTVRPYGFEQMTRNEFHEPHAILGLHNFDKAHNVIRLWRPGAEKVFLEVRGEIV